MITYDTYTSFIRNPHLCIFPQWARAFADDACGQASSPHGVRGSGATEISLLCVCWPPASTCVSVEAIKLCVSCHGHSQGTTHCFGTQQQSSQPPKSVGVGVVPPASSSIVTLPLSMDRGLHDVPREPLVRQVSAQRSAGELLQCRHCATIPGMIPTLPKSSQRAPGRHNDRPMGAHVAQERPRFAHTPPGEPQERSDLQEKPGTPLILTQERPDKSGIPPHFAIIP